MCYSIFYLLCKTIWQQCKLKVGLSRRIAVPLIPEEKAIFRFHYLSKCCVLSALRIGLIGAVYWCGIFYCFLSFSFTLSLSLSVLAGISLYKDALQINRAKPEMADTRLPKTYIPLAFLLCSGFSLWASLWQTTSMGKKT